MTRAKLEALVEDLIARTLPPCQTALKDAGISASEIDEVVMVGGMTRMPKVIDEVKNFFGKDPNKSVNPDEVVACLLYTSPSPRDRTRSRMPSSA